MIERHTLGNGIRVLAQNRPNSFSTSVVVLVKTGSRNETPEINGVSHFLEHVVFKGTEKRKTYKEINAELYSLGARFDAFTSVEYTGYVIHAAQKHFEQVLDLLSDIAFHPTFSEKEIERERGTILQEISMYEDRPTDLAGETFHSLINEDAFVAQGISGTEKTVKTIKPSALRKHHIDYYIVGNTIISCVGKLPKNYQELLNQYFSNVPKGKIKATKEKKNALNKKKVILKKKKIEQANFFLGGMGVSSKHPDRYAADILFFILGGGASSRLFTEVREKRGLAYMIGAGLSSGSDWGYYEVYAGVSPEKIYETISIILEELSKIKNDLTSQELDMAKEHITGVSTLSEENIMNMSNVAAREEMFGSGAMGLKERIQNYKKVTLKDINRVANDLIVLEDLKLTVVGPFQDEQKFVKILER